MTDLKISKELSKKLNSKVSRSTQIYGGHYEGYHVVIFTLPLGKMLRFEKDVFEAHVKNIKDDSSPDVRTQIVGNENNIFSLTDCKKLFIYEYRPYPENYFWAPFNKLSFIRVLAITEHEEGFACLGSTESGEKKLITFHTNLLPNFEEYTFEELNNNGSEDYYLKSIAKPHKNVALVVSENSSGKIYLCSNSGPSSLIYCSKSRLISAISIVSEDCVSLWFESGKVFFHYFSQVCVGNVLFLNKKVICVEKCFCNDKCFLWSNGVNLHHTEINFHGGKIEMRNFIVEKNIVGVMSLIKVGNCMVAHTINENLYEISPGSEKRKEIIKTSAEVFSQIYNESLKIKEIQKDIEVSSECLKFQEMIQNNQMNVRLNYDDKFFTIKNMSGITFKKEFWKIEIALFGPEHRRVKIVELEADLVNEMIVKVEHPFPQGENTKVYLTGQYDLEMVSFCIGIISNEAQETNTLKQMLKSIKHKNYLKINN